MILKEHGFSLCFFDWGFAGLYPRYFEFAMVPCVGVIPYDASFEPLCMQELEKVMDFTDAERQLIKLIRCVCDCRSGMDIVRDFTPYYLLCLG